jgi:hypothetical protein
MGWSTPSSNDYALARMGLKKLEDPDDSAAVGSYWQGEKPREDSGVWEPFNSLPSGRDSGGGQARATQWKKVAEPAWKSRPSISPSPSPTPSPAPSTNTSPAPSPTPAASSLDQSAAEARQRTEAFVQAVQPVATPAQSSIQLTQYSGGDSVDDLGASIRSKLMSGITSSSPSSYQPRFSSFLRRYSGAGGTKGASTSNNTY